MIRRSIQSQFLAFRSILEKCLLEEIATVAPSGVFEYLARRLKGFNFAHNDRVTTEFFDNLVVGSRATAFWAYLLINNR